FDSGDYPKLLRMAIEAIDLPAVRARQKRGEADGGLIGVGLAVFSEQTAHGTTADGKRRALYEQAFARLTPDGRLDVRVGIQNIGQGLETTLAQIASEYLGIDPADVQVRLGDTELSPYSGAAWGRVRAAPARYAERHCAGVLSRSGRPAERHRLARARSHRGTRAQAAHRH